MNIMKLERLKNKKTFIILGSILALLVIIFFIFNFYFSDSRIRKNYMMDLSKIFYEEYYYPQVGKDDKERIDYVDNYTNIGFVMTLKGLLSYTKESKVKNAFDKCDLNESKVKIFPQKPYKKSDYKIITTLNCK